MFYLQLLLAGIATGAIYSLSGMGLVLTYKATGVFNFAHGAVATFVAYILFQLSEGWHISTWIAGPLVVFVVGPGLGVLFERVVFRPLQTIGATTTQRLVATLGIFTILEGIAYAVWTGEVRQGPYITPHAPMVLPGGLRAGEEEMSIVVIVAVVSFFVWFLFRRTHLGVEIRAVVDRRELAEFASINANRIAAISWAMGTGLAGLAGVLLAPSRLDPSYLTLLIVQTYSIAVIARLTSLPIAVGAGVLLLGVGQSLLTQFNPFGGSGLFGGLVAQLKPNLPILLFFVFLIAYRYLDTAEEDPAALVRSYTAKPLSGAARWTWMVVLAAGLTVAPFLLNPLTSMAYGQRMLALAVIFVSIVVITGFSGHITLGQAAFAGIGSFVSARLTSAAHFPVPLAMICGALLAVVAGLLIGFPALRRRGLFLALTTLAFGLLVSSLVLESTVFAGGYNGLIVHRPALFAGQRAFYFFELGCLLLTVIVADYLRSGRLGRILGAMRDSESGARSIGIDLRAYKLFVFGASAFLAGIGGALLSQQSLSYSALQFNPLVSSLVWFTAVVVLRIDSIAGGILAAMAIELLDVALKRPGASELLIGVAALGLGRLPGGSLLGMAAWAQERATLRLAGSLQAHVADSAPRPTPPPDLRLTPLARRMLAGSLGAEAGRR